MAEAVSFRYSSPPFWFHIRHITRISGKNTKSDRFTTTMGCMIIMVGTCVSASISMEFGVTKNVGRWTFSAQTNGLLQMFSCL